MATVLAVEALEGREITKIRIMKIIKKIRITVDNDDKYLELGKMKIRIRNRINMNEEYNNNNNNNLYIFPSFSIFFLSPL